VTGARWPGGLTGWMSSFPGQARAVLALIEELELTGLVMAGYDIGSRIAALARLPGLSPSRHLRQAGGSLYRARCCGPATTR
jgi:hypothetical protein